MGTVVPRLTNGAGISVRQVWGTHKLLSQSLGLPLRIQAPFLWTEKPRLSGALGNAGRVPSPLAGQEILNFPELPVQRKLYILHFPPLPISQNSDLLVANQQWP